MKRILTIAFISFLYVAQAQERETRKITAPDGISSATSLRVDYIHSNRNEVVVEADNPEHLSLIETTVKKAHSMYSIKETVLSEMRETIA